MKTLLTTLLLSIGLQAASAQSQSPLFVDVLYVDGEVLLTVEARDIPVNKVVAAIAKETGMQLEGFTSTRGPQVTIELNQRPLDTVLEYVLGSVGYEFERAGSSLIVHAHEENTEELINRAFIAYLRATSSFPKSERAPEAFMARGWIAEFKDDLSTALTMYQTVSSDYPQSESIAAAYYESGRISEELGNWRDAIQSYDQLSMLSTPHDYHARQRLGRARCDIAIGQPEGTIFKLKTLDLNMPAANDAELAERILVRAQAHNALRDYKSALVALDQVDQLNSPLTLSSDYQRATAIALEGIGMFSPAGRTWMAYAKNARGDDRAVAIETSIELFLQADDEVNALYAVRLAEDLGSSEKLTRLKDKLYERLGLDKLKPDDTNAPAQRLKRAQLAWDNGNIGQAYGELGPLISNPSSLTDAQRTDAACLWAQCIDKLEGVRNAIDFMRDARRHIQSLDNRTRIDLAAAALLESHDMFDEAVDAYGGIYR